ncbi:MAG: hypothetical protein JNK21_08750 [Rhodospirillaceae bacterium]|nr:hypothetical protein [Rhodospirillaceae bacterium]
MSQSVVLSFSSWPGSAEAPLTKIRKRITLKHPAVAAWAQSGSALRISLRVNRRLKAYDVVVAAVPAISGPFFDGAHAE